MKSYGVLSFKRNVFVSSCTRCYWFFSIVQSEFENFDKILLKPFLEVKGLKT